MIEKVLAAFFLTDDFNVTYFLYLVCLEWFYVMSCYLLEKYLDIYCHQLIRLNRTIEIKWPKLINYTTILTVNISLKIIENSYEFCEKIIVRQYPILAFNHTKLNISKQNIRSQHVSWPCRVISMSNIYNKKRASFDSVNYR